MCAHAHTYHVRSPERLPRRTLIRADIICLTAYLAASDHGPVHEGKETGPEQMLLDVVIHSEGQEPFKLFVLHKVLVSVTT